MARKMSLRIHGEETFRAWDFKPLQYTAKKSYRHNSKCDEREFSMILKKARDEHSTVIMGTWLSLKGTNVQIQGEMIL